MLTHIQHRRAMPPGTEDGGLDVGIMRQLFGEAEDTRMSFCEAFNKLGSIACSAHPSMMAANPDLHSSLDFDVFSQWYTRNWCTGAGQAGMSTLVQCPLERVDLQQVRELVCRAPEHLQLNNDNDEAGKKWISNRQGDLQRYQDRIKRLRAYETVVMSEYGSRAILTQRIHRDIFKAMYRLLDCRLNMAERIFGNGSGIKATLVLDCHYFEALFGGDTTGAGVRVGLPATMDIAAH